MAFPRGLLEDYVFPRPTPLLDYAVLSQVCAGLLLTTVYALLAPSARPWPTGVLIGALLGLLAAVPQHVAFFALVRADPSREIMRACWTAGTWGAAGGVISWFLTRDAG